jgi:hypothetical protein
MLFKEKIALCSENHMKTVNILWQNAELLIVKASVAYGYR